MQTKEEVNVLDRVISMEDRIRRAEEIYNRRHIQSNGIRVATSNMNSRSKKEFKLYKKLIIKILICIFIYCILYLIKNTNYIFSENVIEKTNNFLTYDINLQNIYQIIVNYYNDNLKSYVDEFINSNKSNGNQEQSLNQENELNEEENKDNSISKDGEDARNGIGGGDGLNEELLNSSLEINTSADEVKELSQMEIDANEIKANYNLIIPLEGTISSRFGPRTPTQIVSANHEGIDIAVNEGTVFIAAMDGIVKNVYYQNSGYGNHVLIENGDVITLYAHCKTLYVNKGDKITQGQEIGEVGQTGNATGPHLHFEIRKDSRVVDPEYVLDF